MFVQYLYKLLINYTGETIFKCLLTDVFITISGEVDGVPIFAFSTVFDRLVSESLSLIMLYDKLNHQRVHVNVFCLLIARMMVRK